MKVTCLQKDLSKALAMVGRALSIRTSLPVLSSILMRTDQGRIQLTATDLEKTITYWIGGKVEEEGAVLLPALMFTDYIATIGVDDMVEMALLAKSTTLTCQNHRNHATFSTRKVEDFPNTSVVKGALQTTVEASAWKYALSQVVFAASKEGFRPILTGVCVTFDGKTVTLAGADGFRLSVKSLPLPEPVKDKVSVVIPTDSLVQLRQLINEDDEELAVWIDAGLVMFRQKDFELVSTLIAGTFPDYQALIPKDILTKAIVMVEGLSQAVRAAALFSGNNRAKVVELDVKLDGGKIDKKKVGSIVVSGNDEETGDDQGVVDAVVDGPAIRIGVNAKYLSEALRTMDGKVELGMASPASPISMRQVGDDSFVHVVMPIYLPPKA